MQHLKRNLSAYNTRSANFSAIAPCPKRYPYHTTTSLRPQRVFVAYASRPCTHSTNASRRQHPCYTYHLHASRSSTALSPISYAKTSNHQKEAISKRRSCDRATAMTIERYALTAIHVFLSQHTLDSLMLGAFCSLHTSSQSQDVKPKVRATRAQAATRPLTTRMPSWTISSRSKLAATVAVCDSQVQIWTSMSSILRSLSNA